MRTTAKSLGTSVLVALTVLLVSPSAFAGAAGGGGMPWEGPLTNLMSSLQGPVAKVIGVVAIVTVGFGIAFSEGGSGMRKVLWVVLGLTLAFNAASWALPFLGYGGGLAI